MKALKLNASPCSLCSNTMAPTWEQLKNPCAHTHTHTREFDSAMRNKETLPFVTPLDGPSGHYAK